MSQVTQIVETQLRVIDQALGPLNKIATAAGSTEAAIEAAKRAGMGFSDRLFGGINRVVGVAGVLGGALSLHSAWESSERYLKNIKETRELTGATATEADFLASSARKAGVEYETLKNTMFSLSRRGAMLQMQMGGVATQGPSLSKRFDRLGIVMNKGPVKALETMSAALKKGKLTTSDLMAHLRIPPGTVNDFKKFLEGLDKSTLAKIAAGEKIPGLLSDKDVDAFDKMEDANNRIADAWNRIKVLVVSKLYPALVPMAEKFAEKLEELIPKVTAFAEGLSRHMDEIVFAAKVFLATMTAKKLYDTLGKLTSAGGAIHTLAQVGLGGALKKIPGVGAAVTKLDVAGTGVAKLFQEGFAGAGASLAKEFGMKAAATTAAAGAGGLGAAGAGAGAAGAAAAGGGIMATLAAALPLMLAIAAAVYVIYQGYEYINKNVGGIKDRIVALFDKISARFMGVYDSISAIVSSIAKVFGFSGGGIGDVVGQIAAISFEGLLKGIDLLMHFVRFFFSIVQVLVETLAPGFEAIFNLIKQGAGMIYDGVLKMVDKIKGAFDWVVDAVGSAFGKMRDLVKSAFGFLTESAFAKATGLDQATNFYKQVFIDPHVAALQKAGAAMSTVGGFVADQWRAVEEEDRIRAAMTASERAQRKAQEAAARETPGSKPPSTNYDFRGSRFDITQNFAEGFDPDRIAVAFANDLSALGEMRSASNLAPAFAAR